MKIFFLILCFPLLFFFFLALAFFSMNQAFSKPKEIYVLCQKKQKGENWIRIIRTKILKEKKQKTDKKCQTIYTKKGQDKIVGSGKYYETCDQFLKNIKKNLENVNWTCKEKKEIQIWNL